MNNISLAHAREDQASPQTQPKRATDDSPRIVATSALWGPGAHVSDLLSDSTHKKNNHPTPSSKPHKDEPAFFCYI